VIADAKPVQWLTMHPAPNHLLDHTLDLYADTLKQVGEALSSIPDARLAEQPAGVVNHPIWTLGHLCSASSFMLMLLDDIDPSTEPTMSSEFMAKFAPGSKPIPDRAAYPSREELMTSLTRLHARAAAAVRVKHETHFSRQAPENLRAFAPTVGRIAMYLLTCHEPYHLGQLMVWKRAAGLTASA
jgi:hypothetical protein